MDQKRERHRSDAAARRAARKRRIRSRTVRRIRFDSFAEGALNIVHDGPKIAPCRIALHDDASLNAFPHDEVWTAILADFGECGKRRLRSGRGVDLGLAISAILDGLPLPKRTTSGKAIWPSRTCPTSAPRRQFGLLRLHNPPKASQTIGAASVVVMRNASAYRCRPAWV